MTNSIMNKHNKDLIILHYDITLACNNRCDYCYALDYLDNSKLINEDTFYNTIKAINEIKKPIKVDILGGEPLLVVDKIRELLQKTSKDTEYSIFTNLNFNSTSNKIKKISDILDEFNNTKLMISWHMSSNKNNIMSNILALKNKNIIVTLLVNDNNNQDLLNISKFLIENGVRYVVEFLRDKDGTTELTDYDNTEYKELMRNSYDVNNKNMLDDVEYSLEDILKMGYLDIAKTHYVICKLMQLKIDYDGNVTPICSNIHNIGHIRDGINIKDILCNKFSCLCSTMNYKKIMSKR